MAARKTLDLRPGLMPDIRADGDRVTYHLEIAGVHPGGRLIIRCDPDGTVRAAIEDVSHGRVDNTGWK